MARIPGPADIARVAPARDPGRRVVSDGLGAIDAALDVAEKLRANRQGAEDSSFLTELNARATRQFSERFLADQQTATEGADGFTEGFDKTLGDLSKSLVEEIRGDGFRPSQDALARGQNTLTGLRARFGVQAAQFENNARVAKFGATLDRALGQHAIAAFNAPHSFKASIENAERDIDGAESFLPPAALATRRKGATRTIAKGSVRGLIEIDPGTALASLQRGTYDEFLTPAEKSSFLNSAQAGLDKIDTAERNRIKVLTRDHFASIEETGRGVPGLKARAQKALDGEGFEAFLAGEALALKSHDVLVTIRTAGPEQAAEAVVALKPASGEEGFAAKQKLFERATTALVGNREEQIADPAGYLMRHNEAIAGDFEAAGDDPERFQGALEARLAAQGDRAGLALPNTSRRLLGANEARGEVSRILSAPVEERAALMSGLEQRYGKFYGQAVGEMSAQGLDSRHVVLSTLVDDIAGSQAMGEVITLGRTELTKSIDKKVAGDITQAVGTALAPWRTAFEFASPVGDAAPVSNGVVSAVQDLALLYFRQTGDQAQSIDRATSQVVLDRYDVLQTSSVRAYVPRVSRDGEPIESGLVETGAGGARTREQIERFRPLPVDGSVVDEVARERTIRTAVNSGIWATNATGDGLVLMLPFAGGGHIPLQNARGEFYEVSFERLMAIGSSIRAESLEQSP